MKQLILAAAAALAYLLGARGDEATLDGYKWSYSTDGNNATITGVSPATGMVSIPEEIDGYCVKSIGDRAFLDCTDLVGVTIPNTVTNIDMFAFDGCTALVSVSIPSSVTTIDKDAFYGCKALTAVYIDDLAAWCAFDFWNEMDNPLYYAHNLYLNGKKVVDLRIPESVTEIGRYAFADCTSVTNVSIPNNVTRVGGETFLNCTNLTSATLPQCLCDPMSMDGYAGDSTIGSFFRECPLKRVVIADGATSIGYSALGSDTIESVHIPNTVTNIGAEAFFYSPSLTRIDIPDSVEEIGDRAFMDCSALTNIVVGTGLKKVGDRAFETYCEATDIHIRDLTAWCEIDFCYSAPRYNALYLNGHLVENLAIPDGITDILGSFAGCRRLVNITIPASVTNIADGAFFDSANQKNLKSVTFLGDAPEIGSDAFGGGSQNLTFYIPRGNTTYCVDSNGTWLGQKVEYYGRSVEGGMITPDENGSYDVVADEMVDVHAISMTAVVDGQLVDTSKGYDIVVAQDGKSAVVALKAPVIANGGAGTHSESDPSGVLVEVPEELLATKPTVKAGEAIGALPVEAVPGLYYQAAWGDDPGSLTPGAKVQATGESLYLGVVKQTGDKGFYKLSVSER